MLRTRSPPFVFVNAPPGCSSSKRASSVRSHHGGSPVGFVIKKQMTWTSPEFRAKFGNGSGTSRESIQ